MKKEKDIEFNTEDWFDLNYNKDEITTTRSPNNNENDTLKERLNPEKEIRAFKLALMGAYEVHTKSVDEDGQEVVKVTIKTIKNFKPMVNKQGIEEITDYLKNIVNSHTMQSNFLNKEDYNTTCKFTFNMMIANFICKRKEWAITGDKVSLVDIRILYEKAKNIAKICLRRALMDAERGHLSDTVKETINTNKSPERKENILSKVAGILK